MKQMKELIREILEHGISMPGMNMGRLFNSQLTMKSMGRIIK